MPTFKSYGAFDEFARRVRSERRFALDPESRMFLRDVRDSAKARVKILKTGHPLWRAQVGSECFDMELSELEVEFIGPCSAKRMIPDPKLVGDGRLNPRGIAYLYLAEDEPTAIAEVRPWLGALVSVAKFELLRDCKVLDCASTKRRPLFGMKFVDRVFTAPPENEWDEVVWGRISYAFAEPTDPHDSNLTYAPTQILAEALRDEGYDGVLYQSSMRSRGVNVALFDVSSASGSEPELKRVNSIEYGYSESPNMRIVKPPPAGATFK